jgi:hypothetical protein
MKCPNVVNFSSGQPSHLKRHSNISTALDTSLGVDISMGADSSLGLDISLGDASQQVAPVIKTLVDFSGKHHFNFSSGQPSHLKRHSNISTALDTSLGVDISMGADSSLGLDISLGDASQQVAPVIKSSRSGHFIR